MTSIVVWGFLLRLGQVTLEASLTLLVGVVVAGVLRRMVSPAGTRRLFGRGLTGLLRGWLAGMLLPVCSLGVIPVAGELRRAGVPGGTVLAFTLTAPLLNPISFLYGLTLAEPIVICSFALASLFLSTMAGMLWDRCLARQDSLRVAAMTAQLADREPLPAAGPRRLLAVAVTAARELTGANALYFVLGLIGSAALAALIPFGSLQATMKHSDWISPLLMMLLAIPIFSSPLPGMMKIGLMFDHGNSLGAAFVLFIVGIGTNVGLLTWLAAHFGLRRFLPWLLVWLLVVLVLAYAAEPLLYDTRKPELDHTHAFDDYSNPFAAAGYDLPTLLNMVQQKLVERFQPMEQTAIITLALLLVAGVGVRLYDRQGRLEQWLSTATASSSPSSVPWWNRPIPGPVLGAIALLGLIAFSIIGMYIYYPPPEQTLNDLSQVRANAVVAVRTGKREEAIRDLELLDLLTRKLQVGVYLRAGHLPAEARQAADNLREAIEQLRDRLLASDADQARQLIQDFELAYQACRRAFGSFASP